MGVLERLDATIPLGVEESMLLDSVRALARDAIAPRAAEYDRTGEFPRANLDAINALGLNAMFVPEEYGGTPLSYTAYLAAVREISMACAATGIMWARRARHHRARRRLRRHRHAHRVPRRR
jgi:alkylation response protein AidB-like acyl-CoA dehydrogenase